MIEPLSWDLGADPQFVCMTHPWATPYCDGHGPDIGRCRFSDHPEDIARVLEWRALWGGRVVTGD